MLKVEVINTGTELLLGGVTNTHLGYFGRSLFPLGLRVERQVTVPDGPAIRAALIEAFPRCDILLVSGGLGPTTDDLTREITAELLGRKLVENEEVRATIAARLERRGITFRERMQRQVFVPQGAAVMPNNNGTAPGLYFPRQGTPAWESPHIFLFPGPPRELRPMFENYARPILQTIAEGAETPDCRIYHVVGMGESTVEEIVGLAIERRGDLEVGYCARPNEVDFRLIGPKEILDEVEPLVREKLGSHIVSQTGESLEQVVVKRLGELGKTVATAESCTGGLVAHRLTNVPGASGVFREGFVTYANTAKIHSLGVDPELIISHGEVSEPVARAMAEGAMAKAGTDFGIGITGIAGPTGETPGKPVGTVFIALAERDRATECAREFFPTERETFKRLVSQEALDRLRRRIS